MNIYVIRHGQTHLNKLKKVNGEIDEPLTPEGIKQVKETISSIPHSISRIYSSPLLRAKQTAEIINSALALPLVFHDAISEIRIGSLAGKSWEEMENGSELKKRYRSVQFDHRAYGGESVIDVKKRLLPFLKTIQKKHNGNEVLLVTHGGIIRLIRLLAQGITLDKKEKNASLLTFDLDKILKNS